MDDSLTGDIYFSLTIRVKQGNHTFGAVLKVIEEEFRIYLQYDESSKDDSLSLHFRYWNDDM